MLHQYFCSAYSNRIRVQSWGTLQKYFLCEIVVSMHYYLARAVYTCMYEYDLIFKWCCLCGGTITMECLGMTMCFYGLKSIRKG